MLQHLHQQSTIIKQGIMTCLLPHFISQPSTPLCRGRETVCFRTQCAVSISPPAAPARESTKFDIEKLRLSYVQSSSSVLPGYGPLTYINPFGNPSEAKFDSTTVSQTLNENDDGVIAAAAFEAVFLARAAAKLAKDVSLMTGCIKPSISESKPVLLDGQTLDVKASQLSGIQQVDSIPSPNYEPDELEPTLEELQRLEAELAESVVVRSTRQVERKTKRGRATEKVVSSSVTVKVGSNGRKKRVSVKEVDFNDPLRHFRATTNTSKLLTAAEELQMSAGIQDLLKLEKLFDELQEKFGREPSVMQWAAAAGVDQTTLRSRIHHGTKCKARMIKGNIRLVISIAKNYQGAGMNLQDLVQEGCRGLARGVEKFDASKGFKFSTYAHWWIKQAVRKSLSDQSRTIRLPFHMVEATYRVKEARKQLISDNGRQPDNEEIAEATGLSMKRLTAVLMTPKAPRSLDQKIGMNMNLKPSEVTADPEAETSEDLLTKQFMRQDLEKVLDALGTRERQVIRWRYGLEDGRMKTLQEIGELLSISRERVRQIELSAFKKLQNKKKTQHLEQYLVSS